MNWAVFCIFYIWTVTHAYSFSKITYPLSPEPIDVIIPCSTKDKETIDLCIQSTRKYVKNIRRIIVISKEPLTHLAEWFDEKNYPFSKEIVALELFDQREEDAVKFLKSPASRIGWIYQQFLKLYAPFIIPEISSNVLAVDADVIWLKPIEVMTEQGEPLFATGTEYHPPYFDHISRLLEGLKRVYPEHSGVVHHMLFQKPILEDLLQMIQFQHNMEPWKAICHCIDHQDLYFSSFSEYEIYFNFALLRTEQAHLRPIRWGNCDIFEAAEQYKKRGYVYVACHDWRRKRSNNQK